MSGAGAAGRCFLLRVVPVVVLVRDSRVRHVGKTSFSNTELG